MQRRSNNMSKNTVYIAGPISGLEYSKAVAAFCHAEWKLRRWGYLRIVNPTKLCREHWSWMRCMATCLLHLLPCANIYMLKGWETSRGARFERAVARLLCKKVMYES